VLEILSVKRFTFGIFCNIFVAMSITYIAPSLSIALKGIGFEPDLVGVSFAIPALLYIISCLLTPFLTQILPKRLVITFGLHLLAASMFMIGSDGSIV